MGTTLRHLAIGAYVSNIEQTYTISPTRLKT